MNAGLTAVIADISRESAGNTRRMLEKRGLRVVHVTDDGAQAVAQCSALRAGFLVIDQVIPSLDGAAAAARLRRLRLLRYPAVIIACYPGMTYSIKDGMTGVCAIEKPVSEDALYAAIDKTIPEARQIPEKTAAKLGNILDRLAVPMHPGREFLIDAAFLVHEDGALVSALTGELYPMVARRKNASAASVERAMRHVIETAWSVGNIEEQYSVFKGTIDAAKGKPTCGGMIAQLAEMLRMEDEE